MAGSWWRTPEGVADASIAVVLHWVTVIVAVLTIVVGVGTAATLGVELRYLWANVAVVLLCAVVQWLLRKGHARRGAGIFIFAIWAVITWTFLNEPSTTSSIFTTYFAVIAVTSVLQSRPLGLAYAALSVAVLGVATFLQPPFPTGWQPDAYAPELRFIIMASALLMTGGVMWLAAGVKDRADARARESEKLYAELVRTAPEALLTVDEGGVVRNANPAAEILFGSSQLTGKPVKELPGLAGLPSSTEQVGPLSCVIPTGDGERQVDAEVRRLEVAGRQGRRVSLRDVTAQRAAERDRARLKEQLHQVQRLESIGQLAGGIAHDFNNLITALLANIELLRHAVPEGEPRQLLSELEDASNRAANLTRQLLAFSRRQVLVARNVSPSETVEALRPMLRRLVSEDIEMRYVLDAKGIIRADTGQLEQVLVNLVLNARDAMPKGGVLTVSTKDVERTGPNPVPGGRYVGLVVQDEGVGMSREVADRVFEPFFTTKEPGKGTGLGLAVVDGVVRQSNGFVLLESAPGRGTTFEVLFPRIDATAPDRVLPPPRVKGSGDGRRVLIIEDEPALMRVVSRTFEEAGFTVLTASNGEEALAVAERTTDVIDLVVSDVVMPRLDGPEAVRRLRERRPGLRVLLMSGYTDRDLESLGATSADAAFIGKPFRPQELLATAFALLARPRA